MHTYLPGDAQKWAMRNFRFKLTAAGSRKAATDEGRQGAKGRKAKEASSFNLVTRSESAKRKAYWYYEIPRERKYGNIRLVSIAKR